jgi:hypothetical protein
VLPFPEVYCNRLPAVMGDRSTDRDPKRDFPDRYGQLLLGRLAGCRNSLSFGLLPVIVLTAVGRNACNWVLGPMAATVIFDGMSLAMVFPLAPNERKC